MGHARRGHTGSCDTACLHAVASLASGDPASPNWLVQSWPRYLALSLQHVEPHSHPLAPHFCPSYGMPLEDGVAAHYRCSLERRGKAPGATQPPRCYTLCAHQRPTQPKGLWYKKQYSAKSYKHQLTNKAIVLAKLSLPFLSMLHQPCVSQSSSFVPASSKPRHVQPHNRIT